MSGQQQNVDQSRPAMGRSPYYTHNLASTPVPPRPVAIAPASTNGKPAPASEASAVPTMNFTCVICARRKVKCDKTGPPCSTCKKSRLECFYEAPTPRKRKRKQADDVLDRLEQYERILKEHGLLEHGDSPSDVASHHHQVYTPAAAHGRTGKLLSGRGKSRYINSALWKNLGEDDFNPSSDEGEDDEDAEGAAIPAATPNDPVSAYLLSGGTSAYRTLLDYHPTYDIAMKLWNTYVSHVEPIAKLVHVPTGRALVARAAANPSTAAKATECLLFAIYHFAVVAMSDQECQEQLGQSRSYLRSRYYEAARQAMVNANFLRTSELKVLQAYILFLLSVRNRYDPHTFWILTGVAVRIAQRMGLHRDGEALGLKPFDVEMHRRIFWQLLPLDGMSAQVSGTDIAVTYDSWDTLQARNLNDEDIWPEMTEKPKERTGATDIAAIEKDLDELENTLESKFFRYCDIVEPLHCLTLAMGRGAMSMARLRLRLPRMRTEAHMNLEERKSVYALALRVMDYCNSVLSNPVLSRYSWHLQSFLQYDPLIWLLNEVRSGSPAVTDPAIVWNKVNKIFELHPQFMTQKRALNLAICKLTLRSWDTQPMNGRIVPEPGFITQLRAFLAKREGSSADNTPGNTSTSPWNPVDAPAGPPDANLVGKDVSNDAMYPTGMLLEDFDDDNFDWQFWDQLTRDPAAFSETFPTI
ncbi:putative transcriptional regulatory protein [Teratosphaeria destructans]|uniref:Transcriptional regulatory protein n=1 Tax=Teratosphaeria destructans TaxID=418781 RepID=A0A9W7W524_9PEZI|nr:putative transcriptional regulatory protein [Teratosphaeria destructans]